MPATASYGSVSLIVDGEAPARPRSSTCASLFKSTLTVVVLVLLTLQFGVAPVLTGMSVVLVALYIVVFVAFCFASRPLVHSLFLIPIVALRMQLNIASTVVAYACRGFKPLYPQWDLTFEITVKSMRFMFEEFGQVIAFENSALMREPFAMHGRMILKSNCLEHNTTAEKLEANGMAHMWMRDPECENKPHRVVVIHFHGGGFAMSDPLQDVELANQTHTMLQQILKDKYALDVSVDVLLANYRKSPENPFPTPLNDCFAMYQHVLKHENVTPDHVLFSGDSAGAEMSLANCMRMRDAAAAEQQPLGCLLYSPSVDFGETGGDDKTPHCMMPATFVDSVHLTYLAQVTDPEERRKVSPINCDLRDLPPMFVQYGTLERFYEQGMRMVAKAKEQGVANWRVDLLENMPHDVVMLPSNVSPAAKTGVHHGCEFAAELVAKVVRSEARPLPIEC